MLKTSTGSTGGGLHDSLKIEGDMGTFRGGVTATTGTFTGAITTAGFTSTKTTLAGWFSAGGNIVTPTGQAWGQVDLALGTESTGKGATIQLFGGSAGAHYFIQSYGGAGQNGNYALGALEISHRSAANNTRSILKFDASDDSATFAGAISGTTATFSNAGAGGGWFGNVKVGLGGAYNTVWSLQNLHLRSDGSGSNRIYIQDDNSQPIEIANGGGTVSFGTGATTFAGDVIVKRTGIAHDIGSVVDLATIYGSYSGGNVNGNGGIGLGFHMKREDNGNNGLMGRVAVVSRSGALGANGSGFGSDMEFHIISNGTFTRLLTLSGGDGLNTAVFEGNVGVQATGILKNHNTSARYLNVKYPATNQPAILELSGKNCYT